MFSDKKLLETLVNKYEKSVLSKQGSNRKLVISVNTNQTSLFPHYWDSDSYQYRDEIEKSLKVLEKLSLIEIQWNHSEEIESVHLLTAYVDKVYDYLKRPNPQDTREVLMDFLNNNPSTSLVIQSYQAYLIDRLNTFQPITQEFNDIEELKHLVHVVKELEAMTDYALKRHFSQRVLKDSKAFNQIESKVCSILKRFDPSIESLESNEEILNHYYVVNTPTYVHLKGPITLCVDNQVIQLNENEWVLTDEQLKTLQLVTTKSSKVITIENLSPFIDYEDPEAILIYTAGFHGRSVRTLLMKLHDEFPAITFHHFGDIDAGGFHIYRDLIEKTSIDITPLHMDKNTLEKNQPYWKPLTEQDKRKLTLLKGKGFDKVIDYMVKNNCKLEQETLFI